MCPYIPKDKRNPCDEIVDLMKDLNIKNDGDLNYILYRFVKETVKPSYNAYKNALGELECCKLEIYRCLVAPYEDKKKEENGDV